MIFESKQANAIADSRITRIYLPVRPGSAGAPFANIPLRRGADVPVTTRGAITPLCTVRVLQRLRTPLRALTLKDVRAGGWRTTNDFREAWVTRHDGAWIAQHNVLEISDDDGRADVLRERFTAHWTDRLAWVVTIAVVTDVARFMAVQRGRALGDGQYTPIAGDAIDHAEVPPARWLDHEAAKRAEHSERMRAGLRRDADAPRGLSNRALRHIGAAAARRATLPASARQGSHTERRSGAVPTVGHTSPQR
jgi:hypothetical protein